MAAPPTPLQRLASSSALQQQQQQQQQQQRSSSASGAPLPRGPSAAALATGLHRTTSAGLSDAYQVHEDDPAEIVVVCQPGLSKLMVRLAPHPPSRTQHHHPTTTTLVRSFWTGPMTGRARVRVPGSLTTLYGRAGHPWWWRWAVGGEWWWRRGACTRRVACTRSRSTRTTRSSSTGTLSRSSRRTVRAHTLARGRLSVGVRPCMTAPACVCACARGWVALQGCWLWTCVRS
jgi:hypothetical protein